jgi:23S rRNA (uridine2552-2'-O)-methyltransferase|tara:strand:- start:2600 stop:3205 length:606 start_codon:yes stop_codon:yes gene_type:complete
VVLRFANAKRDLYRKLAKKEGYRSRAAYKLIQLDKKYNLLTCGSIIIDFGAAPGGWMQISSEKVGEKGLVLGIDLRRVSPFAENTIILTYDIFDPNISEKILGHLPRKADVVLSDLSPDIIGVWQVDHLRQIDMVLKVVDLLPHILQLNGNAILKIFEGEATRSFLSTVNDIFSEVHISKPPASRNKSSELYLVCKNYRAN